MQRSLLVIGSLNMDLVITVPHHPMPGETVLGGDYATYPGGKGANQAVAAARVGAPVQILGCVGTDAFGDQLRLHLSQQGVDTTQLHQVAAPSGVALITVDPQGQNIIVVSPGANAHLTRDRLPANLLAAAAVILIQLEIPLATVAAVIQQAQARGQTVILNPAPYQPLPDSLLQGTTYIVMNQTEAAALSGQAIATPAEALLAATTLRQRGVQTAIVTLGAAGVVWASPAGNGQLPAHTVPVIDTTAAGDAFCGGLAAQLTAGASLEAAIRFANAAGAIAVTRRGAQPSLGDRTEIERLLADQALQ